MRTNRMTGMILTLMTLLLVGCSDPTGPGGDGERWLRLIGDTAGTVGGTIKVGFSVTNHDRRPIKGETILWEIMEGSGEILAPSTTSDNDGEAWTSIQLDTIAQAIKIIGHLASDRSKGRVLTIVAEPGPAVDLHAVEDTVRIMAHYATPDPLVFEDRYGNPITGRSIEWVFDKEGYVTAEGGELLGAKVGTLSATASLDDVTAEVTLEVLTWASISGHGEHNCGLLTNGQAYCWGSNRFGQLGVSESPEVCRYDVPCSTRPIPVETDLRFASIRVGWQNTCALTEDGTMYCWGRNDHGQLGGGFISPDSVMGVATPVEVLGSEKFQGPAVSNYTTSCALGVSGAAYCWGQPFGRMFGDGQAHYSDSPVPIRVSGNQAWRSLSVRTAGACALDEAGKLHCWGMEYVKSEGTTAHYHNAIDTPTLYAEDYTFVDLVATNSYLCGTTTSGDTYCWGHNSHGQLGLGYDGGTHREPTQPLLGGVHFAQIAPSATNICALDAEGAAYCWGGSVFGELGGAGKSIEKSCKADGTACVTQPMPVPTDLRFSQIQTGRGYTCGLSLSGTVYCWGLSYYGQVGDAGSLGIRREPTMLANPLLD